MKGQRGREIVLGVNIPVVVTPRLARETSDSANLRRKDGNPTGDGIMGPVFRLRVQVVSLVLTPGSMF